MTGLVQFTDLSTSGKTTINGANITTGTLSANRVKGGTMEGSSLKLTSSNAINVYGDDDKLDVKVDNTGMKFYDNDGTYAGTITAVNTGATRGVGIGTFNSSNRLSLYKTANNNEIAYYNATGGIHAYGFHTISLASKKDNINEFNENATDLVNTTKVYSYNYKKDKNKKQHIGFVIGKDYITSDKLIFDDAIDVYTVCGILWKSVQELSKKIKELEERESDK